MNDDRIARIEAKLDGIGEALVALARMEERMITLFNRMDRLDNDQDEQSKRIRRVEDHVGSNGQMIRFVERVFWIVAAAAISYVFWRLRG